MGQDAEKKLFTRVLSTESGIKFSNLIPENDFMNIISHPNHWNGGGVAIGDLNNDGLPEVYFTGNHVSDKLFLNKGNLRFDDITESAKLDVQEGWKTGVTLVDINQDGWLDIYVCKAGPNDYYPAKTENLLYINNGDLTFKESAAQYGVNDNGLSIQAVFFDMDNDGDQDLFVANNNHELSYGSNIYSKKVLPEGVNRLYRNNGNGRFEDVSASAGILSENALTLNLVAADLNNDGLKDIYVSNDLVSSDHVYMNQGNGVFLEKGREMFKHYCSNAMGSDIADFNNDGLADVLVVDMFPENPERQKNQAGITNDYFESMVRQGHHPQYVRNTLSLNNGNGTFSDVAHMAGVAHTDWSWCPLFADFDNDGLKDILVTNSLKKNILDNDFRVYKMDSIMRFVTFNEKTALYKALNKTESLNLKNYIFKNKGDLRFEQAMEEWGLNDAINTTSAAYGDLDNDGDLDLVLNNLDTAAWLYRNNSNHISENGFIRFIAPPGTKVKVYSNGNVQVQEFVGAKGYQSHPESTLHFGLANSTAPDSAVVYLRGNLYAVMRNLKSNREYDLPDTPENFDANSQFKKAVGFRFERSERNFGYKHSENKYDDFKRQPLAYEKHSQPGPCSCRGDLDGNGLDDLYVSGAKDVAGKIFLQQSDGTFIQAYSAGFEPSAQFEDGPCVIVDLDNDGDNDLYVSSVGYELEESSRLLRDRVYLNNGSAIFKESVGIMEPRYELTGCVNAYDVNEDGFMDLFVGGGAIPGKYPMSYPSRILINEGGKELVDKTDVIASGLMDVGLTKDAVWTDIDSDGKEELVVVGYWMPIIIFRKDGQKLIRLKNKKLSQQMNGFWQSIVSADIDADGDQDLVIGNRGLNSRLKATQDEPIKIYCNDFDNNGKIDPILTYFHQGHETVIHTRDALLDQMIGLKKKFLTYKQYAKAGIQEIVGKENLRNATVYEVNKINSVALMNDGSGNFSVKNLPRTCQSFPVRSMVVSDLDKDERPEIIMAGNSVDAHFSYGKDQAGHGMILYANDSNELEIFESYETGLLLEGEIPSMQLFENNGSTTLIAFRQFNKPVVYKLSKP